MSYNGKWDLSPNALFCMIFRLFKGFPSLSYRKKLPLSSVFNPHEHELLAQSQPGERPAAAGGSRPTRRKPNDRRNAGERKPMKCRIKSQTDFGRRLVNRAFGAASAGGTACRGRGEPSHPAKSNDPAECRREKTDEVPNQKPNGLWPPPCQPGFWRSFSRGNGLPRQGGAVPPGKIKRPGHEAGERKPMKHNTKNRKGAAA